MILIHGKEEYFNNQKLAEIKNKFTQNDIIFFDGKTSLEVILSTLYNASLFGHTQLIICSDLDLLSTSKLTKEQQSSVEKFIKYVSAHKPANELVFVLSNQLATKNPLTDFLLHTANVYESKEITKNSLPRELNNYINKKGGSISSADLLELIDRLPPNLTIMIKEIDKLLLLNPHISWENINKSVGQYLLGDTFAFANAIQSQNFSLMWKTFKQRIYEGDDVHGLIGQIGQIFVLGHQIDSLQRLNYNLKDISNILNVHEFRIKKISQMMTNYSLKEIQKIIKNLKDLDQKLKESMVDPILTFELFLLLNFE
ncbi:DNA polymerase III subunit delta [Mycoplasmopsis sturni]|uniref:DNA polymerase III subunit delta n=1 Tax=Mycoplasmopsis sturni TaxID=39047 RepID=UPI0005637B23|nr:hypothetical protein [Mycoplasmopsis sturni]